MDLNTSLYKADRELVSHGITTIFHSLSVYGAHVFDHKPIRDFGNVSALIDRVAGLRADEERDHLIRHRLHMRVELDSVDLYDDIEAFLRSGKVDLVSFMDHTPGQGQYRDLLLFGDTLKGYRDVTDDEVRDIIRQQQESSKMTYAQIAALASIACERGISIASQTRDLVWRSSRSWTAWRRPSPSSPSRSTWPARRAPAACTRWPARRT